MGVDYRKQYLPEQLEPFWPNEIMKMGTAVLCTLAVIMLFAIMPVLLDVLGLHHAVHHEEPADPFGTTPVGIKPEWYFLAAYQILRLMPTALFGVSGKTLGVCLQGLMMLAILTLPFWYRRSAHRRPRWGWRIAITLVLAGFLCLTIWGGWPAVAGPNGEQHVSLREYLTGHLEFFVVIAVALVTFYALIARERHGIRKTLGESPPPDEGEDPR